MKVDFFMPKYMKSFKCIASKCIDTCCAGWEINLDKETFFKYKNSDGRLKDVVKGKFVESVAHDDDLTYGYMNVEDNKCPFLDENLLCEIHGKTNDENLSITCRRYPRIYNIIDGIYEKSGTSSCIEVCQKAFLSKEKMEFVEWEEDLDVDTVRIGRILDTEAFLDTGNILEYFWNIRIFTINVMQERKFTIFERLNILKYIYKYILKENETEDFYIDEFLENIDMEKVLSEINITEDNKSIQNNIFSKEIIKTIRGIRFKQLLESKNILKDINDREILKQYDYILENYLVNHIFKEVIPFNKGFNLESSIDELIEIYLIVEGYLIGFIKKIEENITSQDIINIIQAINKDLEHNKDFRKSLNLI
ncbi:MAG: flagellin lysine-N-methylase [Clostridium sp.]|uniref:flagellin lysine-N-methylase n=1 Tax=Clostridium sp. TaxID=1506 RepID=UPI003EE4FF9F